MLTIFLCQRRIFLNLAPSSTFSMSCASENGTIFGVAALDISLGGLFSELLSFSYGQYSYGVVTDVKGNQFLSMTLSEIRLILV